MHIVLFIQSSSHKVERSFEECHFDKITTKPNWWGFFQCWLHFFCLTKFVCKPVREDLAPPSFIQQLKMGSGQISRLLNLLGAEKNISRFFTCPQFWSPIMFGLYFENMSWSLQIEFFPSAMGKQMHKLHLFSFVFLLNLKGELILNPVAICYNIMRTFILEFNIAQIFKCALKCRSTCLWNCSSTIFTFANSSSNRKKCVFK